MSRDGDDAGSHRPRRSWREIDAARDGTGRREERRAPSPGARARADSATKQYLKDIEGSLFSASKAGAEGDQLTRALRESHGSPGLDAACAAYRARLGIPEDPSLLALFLDARDPALLAAALDATLERIVAGRLAPGRGLAGQLRLLAQSPDDGVAERAEAVLDSLPGID